MEYKTDSLLVHLARAGDEDACEKLVKKYYSSIYQYCLLHIYDPYEAEDLTQETFIKAFRALNRFDAERPFKSWLYTIATNTGLNALRGQKRRGTQVALDPELPATRPANEAALLPRDR